jgi:hypothetical protein
VREPAKPARRMQIQTTPPQKPTRGTAKTDGKEKRPETRRNLSRPAHHCPNPFRASPASTTLSPHRSQPRPRSHPQDAQARAAPDRHGRRSSAVEVASTYSRCLSAWIWPCEYRIQWIRPPSSHNRARRRDHLGLSRLHPGWRLAHHLSRHQIQPPTPRIRHPRPPSLPLPRSASSHGDLTCKGNGRTPAATFPCARAGLLAEQSGGGEVEERRGRKCDGAGWGSARAARSGDALQDWIICY